MRYFGSLKLATVGIFTPWKLANTTSEDYFLFFRELIYQHTTV